MNNLKSVIRWSTLKQRFGGEISKSTIDRWIKAGNFPEKVRLGPNSIGWREHEVDKWFQERI